MKRIIVALIIGLIAIKSQLAAEVDSISMVKTIKIGSMGQSDEAERLRLLLDDELGKAGFATTDDEAKADAILTGALSVRVYDDSSKARVSVQLKTTSGKRLWGQDFGPHFSMSSAETVRLRAQDVAKALKKEVTKKVKK